MKQYWLNDGKPLGDGRLCYVIDLEDGSMPIKTYGKNVNEVLEKVARTTAHAEMMLPRLERPAIPVSPRPVPVAPRRQMTADEQLIATAELSQAGKAPSAIARLLEAETGIDLTRLQAEQFSQIAVQWRQHHPDFYDHPANVELLTTRAIRKAGGLKFTGYEHLEDAYRELQAEGKLIAAIHVASANINPQPSAAQPGENPAPSVVRPRSGTFATSYRSSSVGNGSTRVPQKRLKYTREEVEKMPLEKYRRLVESGDADFAEAVEYYSQPRKATA